MTICNPKLHVICGACGSNKALSFEKVEGDTFIKCGNCSFVVELSEVMAESPQKLAVSVQLPTTEQGSTLPQICPNATIKWVVCSCNIADTVNSDMLNCDGKGEYEAPGNNGFGYNYQCNRESGKLLPCP